MKLQTGIVAGGNEFAGREQMLERISLYLSMNQSIVLVASRRYGKTSIMKKVVKDNPNYRAIELDLMKVYNKKDLAEKIIAETYKHIGIGNFIEYAKKISMDTFSTITKILEGIGFTIDDAEINLSFKLFEKGDEDALLEHALSLPDRMAQKLNVKFIFAVDELGEIVKLKDHERILDLMRSVFQHTKNVTYMFAGSQYSLMNGIFSDKNSPFFRFAEPIVVPPMKAEEFKGFFEAVFKAFQISLYRDFTKDVVNISGGIPYYIVKIAQIALIETKLSKTMNTHPFGVCRAALMQYRREEAYFDKELEKLKGKKHYISALKAVSKNLDPYKELKGDGVQRQNVRKILVALEDDGLIEQRGKEYTIIDPFLQRYVRKGL